MAGSPSAPGTLYRDASLAAREHSTDALLAYADALAVDVADPGYGDAESNAVARFLAGERLRALTDELERRERLSRIATGVSSVADARYAAWRDLARLVRDRIDITDVFRAVGWDLTRQGHDSRRGGAEWSGACPLCGGSDRLRIWDGPNGRAWCRQCRWSADVITAAQSLLPGCAEFRDAVRTLAQTLALAETIPR